jgi:DNA-binding HxlR family transcriptional regulator
LQLTTVWLAAQVCRRCHNRGVPCSVDDSAVSTSPLDAALARMGDRWSFLVVGALLDGPRRFGELQATLPGIAPNILTDRLRRLERAGIVIARRYVERPVRLTYGLSEDGQELAGVLRLLAAWGARGSADDVRAGVGPRHRSCGSLLEARWYCPTCARTVDEEEGSGLRYA